MRSDHGLGSKRGGPQGRLSLIPVAERSVTAVSRSTLTRPVTAPPPSGNAGSTRLRSRALWVRRVNLTPRSCAPAHLRWLGWSRKAVTHWLSHCDLTARATADCSIAPELRCSISPDLTAPTVISAGCVSHSIAATVESRCHSLRTCDLTAVR